MEVWDSLVIYKIVIWLHLHEQINIVINFLWDFAAILTIILVSENIVLVEKDKIIHVDHTISEHFNHYFANVTGTPKMAKAPKQWNWRW